MLSSFLGESKDGVWELGAVGRDLLTHSALYSNSSSPILKL